MSNGVMTFRVIDATTQQLLERLVESFVTGKPAVFEATSLDDPSMTPERRHFEVHVQTLYKEPMPVAAHVIDQHDNWFQLVLHEDVDAIEFEIITST